MKLEFYKMQASGNDFILVDNFKKNFSTLQLKRLAKELCPRKFSIGADGILVLEPDKKTAFKMRIFNPDGSEAQMCGNGARCVSLWFSRQKGVKEFEFNTLAGKVLAYVNKNKVRIKMYDPTDLKRGIFLRVNKRKLKVDYINTGVPHTVVLVQGLEKIAVENIGRQIRYHRKFKPQGTNVDFVEICDENNIAVRTYERGVEQETLACGTGITAAAILSSFWLGLAKGKHKVKVLTKSGEVLEVYFRCQDDKIEDVWLKGKASLIYRGTILDNF